MLANGTYRTANAYTHPDLFWALRGGGGGTFAVVTSATYRTRPVVPVVAAFLSTHARTAGAQASVARAFAELVRRTPALTDAGWGGYAQLSPRSAPAGLAVTVLVPNTTWAAANATVGPYLDFVRALAESEGGDLELAAAFTAEFPSFWALYRSVVPRAGDVGRVLELGSWLLPRRVLEHDTERVAETLLSIPGLSYECVPANSLRCLHLENGFFAHDVWQARRGRGRLRGRPGRDGAAPCMARGRRARCVWRDVGGGCGRRDHRGAPAAGCAEHGGTQGARAGVRSVLQRGMSCAHRKTSADACRGHR